MLENGRCPDTECVHNLLVDIYEDIDTLKEKEQMEAGVETSTDVTVEKGA